MCVQGPQCSRRNVCVSVYVRVCCVLSCVQLFETPWTVARQAPLSMEFSRKEYWSGLPFPSPGHLSNPEIEPGFPALHADSLPSEPPGKPIINYNQHDVFLDPQSLFIL